MNFWRSWNFQLERTIIQKVDRLSNISIPLLKEHGNECGNSWFSISCERDVEKAKFVWFVLFAKVFEKLRAFQNMKKKVLNFSSKIEGHSKRVMDFHLFLWVFEIPNFRMKEIILMHFFGINPYIHNKETWKEKVCIFNLDTQQAEFVQKENCKDQYS